VDINQKQNSIFDQDLNLSDLWEIIKLRSRILLFSLAIFSLAGIAYSLSLNNIYNSSVKLMPQEELSISSQSINGLSSILGGKKSSRSQRLLIAEELIASQKFIDDLLAKNNLAETVLLAREWDNKNNKLQFYTSDYLNGDEVSQLDILNLFSPMERASIFMGALQYDFDDDSNLVEMSFSHLSPYEATRILGIVVKHINEYIKSYEINRATKIYQNLKEKLQTEDSSDTRNFIAELMQLQLKTIMMADDEEFVYRVIDGPIMPENKSSPLRAYICIFFFTIGLFVGLFLSLITYYFDVTTLGGIRLIK